MNLLFIQGGSRWKFDVDGNVYTDANFNESVWNRYLEYCDSLTVILRKEEKKYSRQEAESRFNIFDKNHIGHVSLPDIYSSIGNVFSIKIRREIEKRIEEEVKRADRLIIRSLGNIYTNTALKYAKKYNKPYLVEVTGFAWESLWYHSLRGKFVAGFKELQYRSLMRTVPYAVYVTNEALQKRYPCSGNSIGCSDVELPDIDENILTKRLARIENNNSNIIIGTAAFLDVSWKGQEIVIRAISELKKKGISNIEYQMIGAGNGIRLRKLVSELGLDEQVHIIGTLPHNEVFSWLDTIDIYVQSSYMEGLCRALVEAMSRACPIICSNVGGNYELASNDFLFEKGNYKELAYILEKLINKEVQYSEAQRSYKKALEFNKNTLDYKRRKFYAQFIES